MSDPRSTCDHSESLYGRCVACGTTWEQQAKATDPRVTDEAVEAACRGSWDHRHSADGGLTWDEAVQRESKTFDERKILLQPYRVSMRAALEAALPHLAPQPVVDRKALERVLRERMQNSNFTGVKHEPVRTQVIDQWVQVFADAVLALINGDAS